ncbi:hypothetical protein KSS87_015826 [Heliosperma pusillum]|nr:hypothetical protein KSS87_015826 [Heliosperma pusillum]
MGLGMHVVRQEYFLQKRSVLQQASSGIFPAAHKESLQLEKEIKGGQARTAGAKPEPEPAGRGVRVRVMIEGGHPFHPKPTEEVIKLMCLEGKRPPYKKLKNYPSELKELLDECWSADPSVRPNFTEIISRLDRVVTQGSKQGWWKDTFKLPWFPGIMGITRAESPTLKIEKDRTLNIDVIALVGREEVAYVSADTLWTKIVRWSYDNVF